VICWTKITWLYVEQLSHFEGEMPEKKIKLNCS